MTSPIEPATMLVTRIQAPDAGPMTLEGTNTYVIRHPGTHRVVVVDPGPDEPFHLRQLTSLGQVELIVLTNHHQDHSESARKLAERVSAPIRALDPSLCVGAPALRDGEELLAGGTRLRVLATPGHTADFLCLHLPDDRELEDGVARGSLLSGDTLLGRGASVIAPEDGALRDHLRSLELLIALGDLQLLPGHGPIGGRLAHVAAGYLNHRRPRTSRCPRSLPESELAALLREPVPDLSSGGSR